MVSDNAMGVAAAITGREFGGDTYHWTALLDSTHGHHYWTALLDRTRGKVSMKISITGRDFRCWSRDQC